MKKNRRIPPLNALKAFEATARHQSITRAAEELCVTQAAVSQQVKQLEEYLDAKLLVRKGRKVTLTDQGRMYLPVLNTAFDALANQTH
ncbi:transcriptional regulator, partial [Vibrio xuii]